MTSSVSETPPRRPVTLTTETVGAERHEADRVLKGEEAEAASRGRPSSSMGTGEDAEVHKEARVGGEVELTKETKERQKTVNDGPQARR